MTGRLYFRNGDKEELLLGPYVGELQTILLFCLAKVLWTGSSIHQNLLCQMVTAQDNILPVVSL